MSDSNDLASHSPLTHLSSLTSILHICTLFTLNIIASVLQLDVCVKYIVKHQKGAPAGSWSGGNMNWIILGFVSSKHQ
jgi:hypothetical protein